MYEKLTKSDVKKIQEEIEHRKLVVRKQAIEAVKEARAHGDLSENFEYHAAKKDKNKNESRIRYLERMLKTAVVVQDTSREDEVGINNTVELYCEDDDEVDLIPIRHLRSRHTAWSHLCGETPSTAASASNPPSEKQYWDIN